MEDVDIPSYRDLLYPTLQVIADRDGSARKDEIDGAVVVLLGLTPEQLQVGYPQGSVAKGSKVKHRLAFARSAMKTAGAVDNSEKGVWTLTPAGRGLLAAGEEAARRADSEARRKYYKARAETVGSAAADVPADDDAVESDDLSGTWKTDLLEVIHALHPTAFERLCARLLRESGCRDVRITGRAGDEGVDGVGILEVSLISFPVYFQAKKYGPEKHIGPDKVRELRGALHGRGDKGILITTASFSAAARDEAARAGAPIDLIDGDHLCDLLAEHKLGVENRPTIVQSFFEEL